MAEEKKPYHEQVAERLIEQLRQGTAPWQRPWKPGMPNQFMPMNPTSGKRYKGINAVHLLSQGYSDPRWLTYKQAVAAGAQVRRGEKGTGVQYWKFKEERQKLDGAGKPLTDAQGNVVMEVVQLERPKVFFATVFNAEQIDGMPPLPTRDELFGKLLGLLQAPAQRLASLLSEPARQTAAVLKQGVDEKKFSEA